MSRTTLAFVLIVSVLFMALLANLSIGAAAIAPRDVVSTLLQFDENNYDHFIVLYQRVPRALMAIFIGAVMACSGAVLQGITRNPLASPALLGINAGATLFVVAGSVFFSLPEGLQAPAAIAGGLFGFSGCLMVARMIGSNHDPRSLSIILSGAVMSMLFSSIANALLIARPDMRPEFFGWISGNINHAYMARLEHYWWFGAIGLMVIFAHSRALTLITLGNEKAASVGIAVNRTKLVVLLAVVLSASTAVAICGPVGFVGLVVPHIVRPLFGAGFAKGLPANAILGATTCLLADLCARTMFAPYVLHTGIMLDMIGGIVFILIVKRHYLAPDKRRAMR